MLCSASETLNLKPCSYTVLSLLMLCSASSIHAASSSEPDIQCAALPHCVRLLQTAHADGGLCIVTASVLRQ